MSGRGDIAGSGRARAVKKRLLRTVLTVSLALGGAALVLLPSAQAQAPQQGSIAPSDLSRVLDEIESQLATLEGSLPQAPLPSAGAPAAPAVQLDVGQRLRDARSLLSVNNHAAAASLLWDVAEQPDSASQREAVFLLGEALLQQGELRTAQRVLRRVDPSQPPRADEAALHLLDLAVRLNDDDRAPELLARLEKVGPQLAPRAAYLRGKYLYAHGENAPARTALQSVPRDHALALRARYLIGAAWVAEGKLDEAETEFRAIVDRPLPVADDDRRTVELSQMALGRIHHERGQSDKAHAAYLRISQKSDLFKDAIYEAAWSAIRAKDFPRAEQSLELLLLAYRDAPQTTYAATEAKMLLGNLLLRRGEPDLALEWFNQARFELQPIVEQAGPLLGRGESPQAYTRRLLEQDVTRFDLAQLGPAPLRLSISADPGVQRFLAAQRDLVETKRTLDEMEGALGRMERRISGGLRYQAAPELSGPRARSSTLFVRLVQAHGIVGAELDALLRPTVTPVDAEALGQCAARRDKLLKEVQPAAAGERDALDASSAARREQRDLLQTELVVWQPAVARLPADVRARGEALLGQLGRLAALDERLRAATGRLDRLLDVRLADAQTRFSPEQDRLREQREALAGLSREALALGSTTLAEVGQREAQRFADVLVRADAGALDVAWARKAKTSETLAQLVRDQKRELRILDEEFADVAAESSKKPAPPAAKEDAAKKDDAAKKEPPSAAAEPEELQPPKEMPPDIAEDFKRYVETARTMREALTELAREGFGRRREQLKASYASRIQEEEKEEKARRTQAIAQFEQFLVTYPQKPRFTPDALFRLAELYFERSSEDFIAAVKQRSGGEISPDGVESGGALPDFSASVALYQRLLRDYPEYRNSDGATYLLGYCLGEMGREAEARQAFLGLVCRNKFAPLDAPAPALGKKATKHPYEGCQPLRPGSRLLAETWTRIGENHFDRAELDAAIFAYSQVLTEPESPLFDKALYKLAWSHYRADRFSDAVKRFDELVVLADQKKIVSNTGERSGSTLRGEAIQYLALSFAERDWDGDGRDDAEPGLQRAEKFFRGRMLEPHVREVFQRMGDVLFDRTDYQRAAEVYKRTITLWPDAPENPKLQERVVLAFERQRNFEQALREREALAQRFAEGSEWFDRNRNNPDALKTAQELADAALMNAVFRRHESAQKLREQVQASKKPDPKLAAQAVDEYRRAAESYEAYLRSHPRDKNAYEYRYYLAESLFYGQRFPESAVAYEEVRDADPQGKYLEDAAYGAVKAREEAVAALYKQGGASGGEPPLPAVGKVQPPVTPMPLPDEVAKLQAAYDRYVALLPTSQKAALLSYKAAEIDFRYLRFAQARPRFADILAKHCKDERAVDAGNALLVSYTIESDLEKLEEWTGKLRSSGCGGGSALAQAQAGSIQKLSAQVRFKKAEQLLAQKQYAQAASLFVEIVDKDPRAQDSDKALFNAAVAQENLKRYGAATDLYERVVRDYPQSPLLDEALFRAAVNHQRFFDFDKAVTAYKQLATEARFKASSHRHDALYNAALIADNDQSYAQAVELWKLYARDPKTSPEDAAQALFKAALAVEKLGPAGRAEAELSQFVSRYGKDEAQLPRIVEAHARIAKAQIKLANPVDAIESQKKAAQLGQRLPAGSDAAEYAAEAAFLLAERRLAEIERQKIGGSGKELENSITDFNRRVNEAVVEYDKVLGYKRATWTLAAYFRMGYVFELYAKALLAAPCPPEVRRLGTDACDVYRGKIEESVAGIEEKAAARYLTTIEQAGRLGVSNQWTKLARVRGNAYRPEKVPLIKDEHIAQQLLVEGPPPRLGSGEAARLTAEAATELAQNKYETTLVLAKQALQRDDRFVPAMHQLALAYYFLGKRELAASIVGVAQSIDADRAELYVLLGFLALAKEDRIAATSAFKKATELDANLGVAWHNLAAQYLQAKNYSEALPAAQRAVTLLPGLNGAHLNYGSALRGVRRYAEAQEAYQRVLQRDPQSADAYFNLGVLHLDAPSLGGLDPIAQRNAAIQYLMRYQDLTKSGQRDDAAEAYIKEARAFIEREQRRQKRRTGQLETPPSPSPSQSEKLASLASGQARDLAGPADATRLGGQR